MQNSSKIFTLIKDVINSEPHLTKVIDNDKIVINHHKYKNKQLKFAIGIVLYLIIGILGKKVYDIDFSSIKTQFNSTSSQLIIYLQKLIQMLSSLYAKKICDYASLLKPANQLGFKSIETSNGKLYTVNIQTGRVYYNNDEVKIKHNSNIFYLNFVKEVYPQKAYIVIRLFLLEANFFPSKKN